MIEVSAEHPGQGNGGRWIGVRHDAPGLLREKEERFVFLLIDFRDPNRSAKRAAKVVVAQPGARATAGIVEKAVGVQDVVAEELVDTTMKAVGSGADNRIDLRRAGAARLRVVHAAKDAKFADGVNAREREQREIGTAIH